MYPGAPAPRFGPRAKARRLGTPKDRRTDARPNLLFLGRRRSESVPSPARSLPATADEDVSYRDTAAMDARLHGTDLGRRDDRDLLVCETLDVPEQEDRSLLGR